MAEKLKTNYITPFQLEGKEVKIPLWKAFLKPSEVEFKDGTKVKKYFIDLWINKEKGEKTTLVLYPRDMLFVRVQIKRAVENLDELLKDSKSRETPVKITFKHSVKPYVGEIILPKDKKEKKFIEKIKELKKKREKVYESLKNILEEEGYELTDEDIKEIARDIASQKGCKIEDLKVNKDEILDFIAENY